MHPESKRREAILRKRERRNSKRELKMNRSKARTNKYVFVREFTAESEPVEPKEVEKTETQENKE